MKISYIIICIIVIGAIISFLANCTTRNNNTNRSGDAVNPKISQAGENPFKALRNMAFLTTPEQLGILLPINKTVVYGVIMDWGIDTATATIVAYQTGDASLYLSTGGGMIGGGQHKNVSDAAINFVTTARSFLDKSSETNKTGLPGTKQVNFYLLTNKGIYAGKDTIMNFENNSSKWLPLFEAGNKVLTELRNTTKSKNE